MQKDIVILAAKRTPMGNFSGVFKHIPAWKLGSIAIDAAVKQSGLTPEKINEVIMGNVLSAGQGQAPARQAMIDAGLPYKTSALTINKMCGSGMKAIMLACAEIQSGEIETAVAGGMESMSQAPYLIPNARFGYRLGHGELIDHMMRDGLEDAYDKGKAMGVFAEMCVEKYHFSREALDEFAIHSLTAAKKANENGEFKNEMAPVTVTEKNDTYHIERDENPFTAKPEKIPQLKPAFIKDGKVTAANSSSISDGAAAVVLSSLEYAEKNRLKPLAKIAGFTTHSQEPAWFTTAPIAAIQTLLKQLHWSTDDVGLFEINEAFAVVTMSAIKELDLDKNRVNIHGGACALGHPIGASGARILVTLIYALKNKGYKRGIATLCIGGGEATAMAVEIL